MDIKHGVLAARVGIYLPILVLSSEEGFYIGTWHNGPLTRESNEHFPNLDAAQQALNLNQWTQYQYP